MGIFNVFKKKEKAAKVRDMVWLDQNLKLKGSYHLVNQYPDAIVISWFSQTKELFSELFTRAGLQVEVMMATDITPLKAENKTLIFLERNISAEAEGKVLQNLQPKEIIILSALDDPLFVKFGAERISKIMQTLNVQDDCIEHPMISAAIKKAQESLAGEAKL